MEKQELRRIAKETRKTLDIERISGRIAVNIENLAEFQKSQSVLLFYPKDYEINLISLCAKYKGKKNFYLPKVKGKNLVVCPFDCETELKISQFKIFEPCSEPVTPEIIDFAIIPCLCADKRGYRIGYGGGFYDRFIPHLSKSCTKIVPVPSVLLYEKLPTEPHDIPVNRVVTENFIY